MMKLLKVILQLCIIHVLLMNNSYAQTQSVPATISIPGPQVGVAWGFSYGVDNKPEIFLPQLRKMDVHLTKLYLFWEQIEPSKGQFHWGTVDSFLNQLTPGDEALISVFSASSWATKSAYLPPHAGAGRRLFPAPTRRAWCPLGDPQPDIRTVGRAATATCEGAVSYDLSGERLTEQGLSGRPHPAPGPRTRRASAGQRYIRWFFRQYYRVIFYHPWHGR